MRSPNFLILDEPTNDLDIVTLGLLEEYLAEFKGCVIVISHDRFFLDTIVDHLFVFEGDGVVKDFPGNYSDYRTWIEENKSKQETTKPEKKPQQATAPRPSIRLTYKEKLEMETLTKELECLNAERNELEALFASGEAIADIENKSVRYNEIKELIDEKEFRWLELSEKEPR